MRLTKALSLLTVSLAVACGEDDGSSAGANGALSAAESEFAEGDADADPEPEDEADDGEGGEGGDPVDVDLECPQGGDTGPIHVEFDCDEVTVVTCKDLSNIVLELADGSRVKYEGQTGRLNSFADAQAIVGVWVKAGDNASGDGPGYGERFDAPADSCDEPGAGDGGDEPADGDAGDGDADGAAADGDTGDGDTADGDSVPPDLF